MPQGGAEIVFLIITSIAVTYIPSSRILGMCFNTIVSIVGLILIWKLDPDNQAGQMVGLTLAIVYAINLPISLSVVTSNVAGLSKKSVVSSLLFIAYCVGNLVGPQFFLASEEPSYPVSGHFVPRSRLHGASQPTHILYNSDRYQGFYGRLGIKSFFPDLLILLLHVGEPSTRPSIWFA